MSLESWQGSEIMCEPRGTLLLLHIVCADFWKEKKSSSGPEIQSDCRE